LLASVNFKLNYKGEILLNPFFRLQMMNLIDETLTSDYIFELKSCED